MIMLAMLFIFLLADRAIPRVALAYAPLTVKPSESDYMKRYGLFSFPRTLLGILFVLSSGMSLFMNVNKNIETTANLIFFILFGIVAVRDASRAAFESSNGI